MKRRYKPVAPVDGVKLVREFATRDLPPSEPNAWELEERRLREKRDAMMAEVFAAPRSEPKLSEPAGFAPVEFQPGDVVELCETALRGTIAGRVAAGPYIIDLARGLVVHRTWGALRLVRRASGFKVGDRVVRPGSANPTYVYTVHRVQDDGLVVLTGVVVYWRPHELELAP